MPQPAGGTVSRPPTMADVARVAGVSHQTVSRVLSGHPHVRENTRADVLRAIEELGYRRNASARTLVTRRTQILGAVASESTLYGPASTLAALEEAARGAGYLLATVALRTQSRQTLAEALEHLSVWGVEGVVVIVPQRDAVAALGELRHPLPLITVPGGHDLPVPAVGVGSFAVTAGATAEAWADGLLPADAETLVTYDHPRFRDFAAVTTRPHGAGRITVVGTLPSPALAADLIRWATPEPVSAGLLRGATLPVSLASGSLPDGRRALSAGDGLDLRLWDVVTGKPLARFSGHGQSVGLLAVSPDGRFAASADAHGFLRIWHLPGRTADAKPRPGARPARARLQGDGL